MDIETVLSCPLGHKCKEIKDNKIYQCAWFVQLQGIHPQTGETVDEFGCSMTWLPTLLIENAKVSKGTSAAVESFRNEMVKTNESSLRILQATVIEGSKLLSND